MKRLVERAPTARSFIKNSASALCCVLVILFCPLALQAQEQDPSAAAPQQSSCDSSADLSSLTMVSSLEEAMMAAALDLSPRSSGYVRFASGDASNQSFNSDYWQPVNGQEGTYAARTQKSDGCPITPVEAIYDITKNPGLYQVECATATKFLYYLAIIHYTGPIGLNKYVKATQGGQLFIGGGPYESVLKDLMVRESSSGSSPDQFPGMDPRTGDAFTGSLMPGDALYMINLFPTDDARSAGWRGENMVYLGSGKFFAHGLEPEPNIFSSPDAIQQKIMTAWGPLDNSDGTPIPGHEMASFPPSAVAAKQKNQAPWFTRERYTIDPQKLAAIAILGK